MINKNKRLWKQMDKFLSDEENQELIAEYDSTEGSYPFDGCKEDIIEKIQAFQKINKGCDFSATLWSALHDAIDNKITVLDALNSMISQFSHETSSGSINTLQTYFKEIGRIYNRHKGEKLEYAPENRDKFIELNTKMVISQAKKYQNLGLSLGELISAGNLGLCVAWDKYNPNKANLKETMFEAIQQLPDSFKLSQLQQVIDPILTYGPIQVKFQERFADGTKYTKQEVIDWIGKNIKNAKFSSIAMMWIRAYILIEIDEHSRLVKKPKSEIYKDKKNKGSYQREITLNLDAPIANDTDTTFADTLGMEDESETDMNIIEAYDEYKDGLNKLLEGVSARDRAVILKRFGIGYMRPMSPKEIAISENRSLARVSQLIQNVLAIMRKNAAKYEIDPQPLFEACSKFR